MATISSLKGTEVQELIKAQAYVEYSARTEYNINEVFDEAIKVVMHSRIPEVENTRGRHGLT
jgi:GTPase SAR1 family protein